MIRRGPIVFILAFSGGQTVEKSSLINALTGQEAALVSDQEGTTTDPVFKAMEIHGIGPCVFIDTAGFDDTGALGELRQKATKETIKKTDIALLFLPRLPQTPNERGFACFLRRKSLSFQYSTSVIYLQTLPAVSVIKFLISRWTSLLSFYRSLSLSLL